MIAKIALLFAAVAAAQATVIAPGLLNAGLISPGWLGAGLVGPAAVRTGSVVAIPGAVSTDSRLIGAAPAVIAGAPLLANGVLANGVVANSLLANGLIGASPLALGKGIVAPIGYRTSLLTAPGVVKTIL